MAFTDPFGLCDPPHDMNCPPGEVTFLKETRSTELQHFARALATNVSGHVVVHSGDRTTVPPGGARLQVST